MGSFWKAIGKGFAAIGKGALMAAIWASDHPQVLEAVAAAAGQPGVASAIATFDPALQAILDAKKAKP